MTSLPDFLKEIYRKDKELLAIKFVFIVAVFLIPSLNNEFVLKTESSIIQMSIILTFWVFGDLAYLKFLKK